MIQENKIIGYLHVLVQTMTVKKENAGPVKANISLGEIAKVETQSKKSGEQWNDVFLIEVPQNPSRLAVVCSEDK